MLLLGETLVSFLYLKIIMFHSTYDCIPSFSEGPRGRIIALDGENLNTLRVIDTVDSDDAFLHAAHFYEEQSKDGSEHPGFHVVLTMEMGAKEDDLQKFGYGIFWGDASAAPLERVASLPIAAFLRSEAGDQSDARRLSCKCPYELERRASGRG